MEKDLNVQLAVRAGRSVGLTEAGRRLAQGLAQGFLTISDSIDDLREREASRGVRVTTTTFAADVIIMPRLSEFWRKHPGVEIALHPTPHEIDIIENGYDFALRASLKGDRVNWPGTEVEHLCDIDLMGVGAPSLLGDGDVDFPRVRQILLDNGFEGWCTVEQDCDPTLPDTDSLRDAKINRAYLQSIGF